MPNPAAFRMNTGLRSDDLSFRIMKLMNSRIERRRAREAEQGFARAEAATANASDGAGPRQVNAGHLRALLTIAERAGVLVRLLLGTDAFTFAEERGGIDEQTGNLGACLEHEVSVLITSIKRLRGEALGGRPLVLTDLGDVEFQLRLTRSLVETMRSSECLQAPEPRNGTAFPAALLSEFIQAELQRMRVALYGTAERGDENG